MVHSAKRSLFLEAFIGPKEWLQFLFHLILFCLQIHLPDVETGKTMVLLFCGIYLSMGQGACALVLLLFILEIGYCFALRCTFFCCYCTALLNMRGKKNIWKYATYPRYVNYLGIWSANKATAFYVGVIFDPTLGYPGEGWSSKHSGLRMATWNTRSMTFERFQYCKNLRYDILALTELWRQQSKFQDRTKSFLISEPKIIEKGPRKGQLRYPEDRAAGVGILLSSAAQKKVKSFGSEGERGVCWVRIKGPICCLFVIAVYLPHRGRTAPSQDDTLRDLEKVLSRVPNGDCVCVLGDLNEQLRGDVKGITGKFVGGPMSTNGQKIMDLMRLHNLVAANTYFKPEEGKSVHTYLATKQRGMSDEIQNDRGEYVGACVLAKYKGEPVKGKVVAIQDENANSRTPADPNTGSTNARRIRRNWIVRFADGYTKKYSKKALQKIMVIHETEKIAKQLDYILISNRRKSCVTNCRPRWAPSRHRDLHGHSNDHALLECTWRWRLRKVKTNPVRDYTPLYAPPTVDEHGNPVANALLTTFETSLRDKLAALKYSKDSDTSGAMYEKFCAAVTHAAETTLPLRIRTKGIKREVSERTKTLFEKRTNMQGTKEQYEEVQRLIKTSSLQDYEQWVSNKWADVIQSANGKGDTKRIYQAVKVLAQKREKPPTNITTDAEGKPLDSAEDVAATWEKFLRKKFAATTAEAQRDPMEWLPCTKFNGDKLSTKEILTGLGKMAAQKACGPDSIPAELYKASPVCKKILCEILKKIWASEEVPDDFACATFTMLYKSKGSSDDPSMYRCIALLNHMYKVLSQCMLARLEAETQGFLPDWQAGFRKRRGCRDNILTLRTIYEDMLERGEELFATFIDYSAAFDSVSHKFLDRALKEAGASNKTRSMFRAMYAAASAATKVVGTDNRQVLSAKFPINRGVVQGDIVSPLYFILALELIFRRHDRGDKGIRLGECKVHTLGYADDAALLDNKLHNATARVTSISNGSREDADMQISIKKTEVMHVCEQDRVPRATAEEARAVCKQGGVSTLRLWESLLEQPWR